MSASNLIDRKSSAPTPLPEIVEWKIAMANLEHLQRVAETTPTYNASNRQVSWILDAKRRHHEQLQRDLQARYLAPWQDFATAAPCLVQAWNTTMGTDAATLTQHVAAYACPAMADQQQAVHMVKQLGQLLARPRHYVVLADPLQVGG